MERTKTFADVADDSRRKQVMAEYIEREALQTALQRKKAGVADKRYTEGWNDCLLRVKSMIHGAKAADVAPVVHGRWVECDDGDPLEDAYNHHKCTNCNTVAPFDYKYREDWDEGMDGEWYSLGIIDDGINEHLTPHCPNCGARMDGE